MFLKVAEEAIDEDIPAEEGDQSSKINELNSWEQSDTKISPDDDYKISITETVTEAPKVILRRPSSRRSSRDLNLSHDSQNAEDMK